MHQRGEASTAQLGGVWAELCRPVSSVILKLCQRMLGDNTYWTPEVLFGP